MDIGEFDPFHQSSVEFPTNQTLSEGHGLELNLGNTSGNSNGTLLSDFVSSKNEPEVATDALISLYDGTPTPPVQRKVSRSFESDPKLPDGAPTAPVQQKLSGPFESLSKFSSDGSKVKHNLSIRPSRPPPPPPLTKKRAVSENSLVDLVPELVNVRIAPSSSTRSLKQTSSFYTEPEAEPMESRGSLARGSRSGSLFYVDPSPDVIPKPITRELAPLNSGASSFYDVSSSQTSVHTQKLMGNREQIMQLCMAKRQEEYTVRQPFKIFAGTWNVNGQYPPFTVDDWLSTEELKQDPPDIYFIGFQELDLSKEVYVFSESVREDEWIAVVSRSLPTSKVGYHLLKSIRLIGMMLLVYVRTLHVLSIKDLSFHQVGTGVLGRLGNKGGVAVRMDLHNTSICAVNSHLAAHVEQCTRRNEDFHDICSRLQFPISREPPLTVYQHDIVIWLGDLNYRLLPSQSSEFVKEAIHEGGFKILREYDQLLIEKQAGNVFQGYSEGQLDFRPTYKYNPGSDDWDTSEKFRTPAWCDRILWWELALNKSFTANAKPKPSVELLKYQQHMKLKISDHKPVSALFNVKVKVIDEGRYKKVFEDENRRLDKLENEYLPTVKLNVQQVDFEEVKFQQPKLQTVEVENTGMIPCNFEFIFRPGADCICKKWLTITKTKGSIFPGEKFVLEFEVYVNRVTAPLLNSGDEKLEDILILHLNGGKDFFITVNGHYLPSCFGTSIEALCRLYKPIRCSTDQEIQRLTKISPNRATDSESLSTLNIPKELWTLVDHLYQYAQRQEDLFQQPGLHSEVENIRDCLDSQVDTGSGRTKLPGSNHSVAEALLIMLEAFPEPVIPFDLYDNCLEVADIFHTCKQILQRMSKHHRNVFKYIMAFLRELLRFGDENGLDVDLCASIFSGLMLRPRPRTNQTPKQRIDARIDRERSKKFIKHFLLNPYDE